ncbi:hypothetical protein M3Y96_00432000 [Aphelenchoides besseyi]|nr:hypothetical protein M3Y96_00432000 [Aphelenchoides besseyi]
MAQTARTDEPLSALDVGIIAGSVIIALLLSSTTIGLSICCIFCRNKDDKPPENGANANANADGKVKSKKQKTKKKKKGRTNEDDLGAGEDAEKNNKKELEIDRIETEYKAKMPTKPRVKKLEESIKGTTMFKKQAEDALQPSAGQQPTQVLQAQKTTENLAPRSRLSAPSQPTASRTSPSVAPQQPNQTPQPSPQPSSSGVPKPSVSVQYY